ncbi:hypothetical protein ACOME3_000085 [Neoechinorhynchus agilis]
MSPYAIIFMTAILLTHETINAFNPIVLNYSIGHEGQQAIIGQLDRFSLVFEDSQNSYETFHIKPLDEWMASDQNTRLFIYAYNRGHEKDVVFGSVEAPKNDNYHTSLLAKLSIDPETSRVLSVTLKSTSNGEHNEYHDDLQLRVSLNRFHNIQPPSIRKLTSEQISNLKGDQITTQKRTPFFVAYWKYILLGLVVFIVMKTAADAANPED